MKVRHAVLVFGDQLNEDSTAFEGFDREKDLVWMAEVEEESKYAWSHRQRIVLFLSAMRHFRRRLESRGFRFFYRELDEADGATKLSEVLRAFLDVHRPEKVIFTRPGEYRIMKGVETVCGQTGIPVEMREDLHFFSTPPDFEEFARGRKEWVMEYFYRDMRRRHGILMEDGHPTGGQWNFDKDNREAFGRSGPEGVPETKRLEPDALTREVIRMVAERFPDHPGALDSFGWPVTPRAAALALDTFVEKALPNFGRFQDAMWTGEPFLFHSLLASSLNLKLLDPRRVVRRAEEAWKAGKAPLAAVEGFIRQILGWREYIRGVYWKCMPGYIRMNALEADEPLPDFYWNGQTPLACLKHCIGDTLRNGYAHHIQRLMVTGLYALLLGVRPREVEDWYLGIYVDAVEWVTLPNTLGMSQYADGGIVGSKPYVATGKYIQRMSNYCAECPRNPAEATGEKACPFTTLYWDFLLRHEERLRKNRRMSLQVRNLDRLDEARRSEIRETAREIRRSPSCDPARVT